MDTNSLIISDIHTKKRNYDVLIEQTEEGKFTATLLGWQGFQTEGKNKEEAVNKLQQILANKLQQTEVISLEIEIPQTEYPWMKFAGMYKDNELFDEVLENIQANRKLMDKEDSKEDIEANKE